MCRFRWNVQPESKSSIPIIQRRRKNHAPLLGVTARTYCEGADVVLTDRGAAIIKMMEDI